MEASVIAAVLGGSSIRRSIEPVLDSQTGHAGELPEIGSDEQKIERQSVSGDPDVIGPDDPAASRKVGAYLAVGELDWRSRRNDRDNAKDSVEGLGECDATRILLSRIQVRRLRRR